MAVDCRRAECGDVCGGHSSLRDWIGLEEKTGVPFGGVLKLGAGREDLERVKAAHVDTWLLSLSCWLGKPQSLGWGMLRGIWGSPSNTNPAIRAP